ncbi:flagellar hook-basal body complex protein FliE [Paenibacillus gansuensis]|uniref:Flagellar hook-basal body complex protein FliE n=1 Tax=Paenibacillus gansuensis TaxID=306542 RepID=A0ABW5PCZ5_9BACL
MIEQAAIKPLQMIMPKDSGLKVGSSSEVTEQFSNMLKNAIETLNTQEQTVRTMNDKFAVGEVDVHQVMIASQKAELGLQLTSQIRNKVIEAYQEIMRTQI